MHEISSIFSEENINTLTTNPYVVIKSGSQCRNMLTLPCCIHNHREWYKKRINYHKSIGSIRTPMMKVDLGATTMDQLWEIEVKTAPIQILINFNVFPLLREGAGNLSDLCRDWCTPILQTVIIFWSIGTQYY